MDYFAKNLKYLREKSGLNRRELSDKIKVNPSTLTRWENEEVGATVKNAIDVSTFFNVSMADLLGRDLKMDELNFDNASVTNVLNDVIKIPVLGRIPAGMPFEAIEDQYTLDYEEIPKQWLRGGKEYFALKLDGDSMEPEYLDKDIIIFQKASNCESGQDCCIKINGFDATFKRVKKQENGIMIIPLNENNSSGFNTTFYTNEEIVNKPVEILGIVKQIRRNK